MGTDHDYLKEKLLSFHQDLEIKRGKAEKLKTELSQLEVEIECLVNDVVKGSIRLGAM